MARVTVEDCVEILPNRFELVQIAAHRTRQINSGDAINVEQDDDKNTVISLREIADKQVDVDALKQEFRAQFSRYGRQDDQRDENAVDIGDSDVTSAEAKQEITDQISSEIAGEEQIAEAAGLQFSDDVEVDD